MQIPPKPVHEVARLALLKEMDLLSEERLAALDELVQLAAEICQTPMSAVSLVYEDKQFFKASVGLDVRETSRDVAFCGHAILSEELFVVEDAKQDLRFQGNPLVEGPPFIRFYAGIPLTNRERQPVGTLCVLDQKQRSLSPQQQQALMTLGHQAAFFLELRVMHKRLQQTMESLIEENAQHLVLSQKMAAMSAIVHDLHHELRNFQLATQPQVDTEKKKFAVLFATHDMVEIWEKIEPELFKIRSDSQRIVEESNSVIGRRDINLQQKKFILSMLGTGLPLEKAQELLVTVSQLDPGFQASIQALFGVLDSFLHMADGARRLNGMTASLLDQIASEASGEEFEVSPALSGTLSLFAKRSRSSGIRLSTSGEVSLVVHGNRSDFQHVILNLLRLAFEQYQSRCEGGEGREIRVQVLPQAGRVHCEVSCARLGAQVAPLLETLAQDSTSFKTDQAELGWSVAQHLVQRNQWELQLFARGDELVFLCGMK